jgi:hypothetical protein
MTLLLLSEAWGEDDSRKTRNKKSHDTFPTIGIAVETFVLEILNGGNFRTAIF